MCIRALLKLPSPTYNKDRLSVIPCTLLPLWPTGLCCCDSAILGLSTGLPVTAQSYPLCETLLSPTAPDDPFSLSELSSGEVSAVLGPAPIYFISMNASCPCQLSPPRFYCWWHPAHCLAGKQDFPCWKGSLSTDSKKKKRTGNTNKPWIHTIWKVWKIPLGLLFKYNIIQNYGNKVKTKID